MRARCTPLLVALGFCMIDVLGCGLGTEGLYVADGGIKTQTVPGRDGAVGSVHGDDADVTGDPIPGDEAGASDDAASDDATSDDASVGPDDGASPPPNDSGSAKDSSPAPTCHQCTMARCPTQLAACGPGSDCIGYRDCNRMCSGGSSGTPARTRAPRATPGASRPSRPSRCARSLAAARAWCNSRSARPENPKRPRAQAGALRTHTLRATVPAGACTSRDLVARDALAHLEHREHPAHLDRAERARAGHHRQRVPAGGPCPSCRPSRARPSPCSRAHAAESSRSTPLGLHADHVRQIVAHRVHRVVRLVAVKRPVAGVVGDELDVARRARPARRS